jgi:general secretion pathway protein E
MLVDDEVRSLVMQRSDAAAIRRLATGRGMRTLRDDGAQKVVDGATTVAEILRVTQEDVA